MAVSTANAYGKITINCDAIAQVAGLLAIDCYGIVDLVSRKKDGLNLLNLMNKKRISRGVKVRTDGDKVSIDLFVIVKYGVSIDAVAQSLKKGIRYGVEKFTGMSVQTVNVFVAGVKV
ncbi:MAG: Asp23/Gls24 family envelope stress response protein [Firmicutes bacterium]|nr:Asp23/Gls24 family envelope stress response protein [Bacillota bacterium]